MCPPCSGFGGVPLGMVALDQLWDSGRVEVVDQKRSWFDVLAVSQRVAVVAVSVVGLVGGTALLLLNPPQDPVAFSLILVYVVSAVGVLGSIPWVRVRLGSGVQLWLGLGLTFRSSAGELETPALRIAGLIVGIGLLAHVLVLAVNRDRRLRQGRPGVAA